MAGHGAPAMLKSRGHPPGPGDAFQPTGPALEHGSDLVAFVRGNGYRLGIGAACSAEKHPESPDLEHEFHYMRLKVEAGAGFLITQLVFGKPFYFDPVARAPTPRTNVSISPGLHPL